MHSALLLLIPTFALASTPAFQCSSNEKPITIFLEKTGNRMETSAGGVKRQIPLSLPNAAYGKKVPGEWLVYHGLNGHGLNGPGLKGSALDLAQEVGVLYTVDESGTQATLVVTIDHRLVQPLVCSASKSNVKIKSLQTIEEQQKAITERISGFASQRKKSGYLETTAQTMVLEMIQRALLISPNGFSKEWVKDLRPHLLKIHKSSMAAISLELKGDAKKAWQTVLTDINYDYFPESERYIVWVKEGVRPGVLHDLDSVAAAFNGFVRLPAFRSEDLKKHFVSDVTPSVKEITDGEVPLFREGMTEAAKSLFNEVWIAATGKKTLANYPLLEEVLKNLSVALKNKPEEFDPQTVEKRAMAFFRSSLAQDEDAKKLFLENARPLFQSLTARQIEDLNSWVEDEDRALFDMLLK